MKPSLTDVFAYLDALRASGITNMYGAGRFLKNAFDDYAWTRAEVQDAVFSWMNTYDPKLTPAKRAEKVVRSVKPDALEGNNA
jgi:hypothetical protein